MTDKLNDAPSPSHFVPCVLRTLEILDALRHARSGLRIEDLRSTSRASRSTTYRIVRSLLHSGYIERDTRGRYHLNPAIIQFAQDSSAATPVSQEGRRPSIYDESTEGFERWGVRFRANGKSAIATDRLEHNPVLPGVATRLDTPRTSLNLLQNTSA